ncbi:MAG: hypothetical protein Q7S13_01465 [Candidatus Omnitrophota bacterium]|nr:hypothetical protein [Candidatus Omnitrophota bacterium]
MLKSPKLIFSILCFVLAWLILTPFLNYQPYLAQGDHGRDLYCFERILQGDLPYKDFWWVYGPLMLYYYAFFYKILGVHISSILIGQNILTAASTLLFFRILMTRLPAGLSLLGALWFILFSQSFFFTFNHIGGITAILFITLMIFSYIRRPQMIYLIWGLVGVLLLNLIKINFGLIALFCLVISAFLTDRLNGIALDRSKKIFYIAALFLVPIVTALVYDGLLHPLPSYVIHQCFPYLSKDHPYNISPLIALLRWIRGILINTGTSPSNILFAFIIMLSTVQTFLFLTRKEAMLASEKRQTILALLIPALFYVLNLHEYLASGVLYRTFWSAPFSLLLIFLLIDIGTKNLTKTIRLMLYAALLLVILSRALGGYQALNQRKVPAQHLNLPRADIFVGNQPAWITTVTETVRFLDKNLKAEELFVALPYDPLYYFLTAKQSPTPQLIFFDHINIPAQQEKGVIADLKKHNVRWVLLSNRIKSPEEGLGEFGKTYCPLIANYIQENFEVVATFGDWANPPGWASNHGTIILRRKN